MQHVVRRHAECVVAMGGVRCRWRAVGWMAGSGCAQPAFRMGLLPGDATLTDVVVEVAQWESAV
jgi:hypothetical protein